MGLNVNSVTRMMRFIIPFAVLSLVLAGLCGSYEYNDKSAAFDNILVNDPSGDHYSPGQYGACPPNVQSMGTIALGPGPVLVASYYDGEGIDPEGRQFTGWSISRDGGATWNDKGHLPPSAQGDHGYPVFARDSSSGVLYLSTNQHRYKDVQNGNNIFRITFDETGEPTISGPANGAPGYPKDHSISSAWVAVDDFPGNGQGNVYVAYLDISTTDIQNGGIFFTRSTDGGRTFGPNRGVRIVRNDVIYYDGRDNPFVAVGPDHTVYVFYQDNRDGLIRLRRSYDRGLTFTGTVDVAKPGTPMRVAVHPVTGALYLVYQWYAYGDPEDKGDIFFTQSLDGGETWSPTIKLNDDNTKHRQSYPTIAITRDGRALGVTWYDSRNSRGDALCRNWEIERWAVTGLVSRETVTWGPNFRVSRKFEPDATGWVLCDVIYGHEQITADNEFFYTLWEDWRDPQPACPANEGHRDANIRFAKFPVIMSRNTTVNAASYQAPVAPASIASVFGTDFVGVSPAATGADNGSVVRLPKELEGTRVTVRDHVGTEFVAPLFYVSPGQVNLQMPGTAALDRAYVFVRNSLGITSLGQVDVAHLAPGLFTADASGQGLPAGYVVRVKEDGTQVQEPLYFYDPSVGQNVPIPIDLGPASDQVFLVLYGTGFRNISSLIRVSVTIGGIPAAVLYAGAQADFLGLDQVNLLLPRALAGRGEVSLALNVDGKAANMVSITMR